jgi:hypothetical protein
MPPWLSVWLIRWGLGERLEKAKPSDYRHWFGVLCLLPVFVIAFQTFGKRVFDLSGIYLWLGVVAFMLISFVGIHLWARFVPAWVSGLLAIVTWVCLFLWLYR